MKRLIKWTMAVAVLGALLAASPAAVAQDNPSVTLLTNLTACTSTTSMASAWLPANNLRLGVWIYTSQDVFAGPIKVLTGAVSYITGGNATNLALSTGFLVKSNTESLWIPVEKMGTYEYQLRGTHGTNRAAISSMEISKTR